ncbi:MAG: Transport permease protein [Patescibacteria group bacterium]|nr:Transport permease protein [Patescibacteria group bacterium]
MKNKKIKINLTKLSGIYILWYREILMYLRSPIKVFTSIFLPILLLVFFGTGLDTLFPNISLPYDFVEFFFPGILALSVTTMALSSTMSIVWDREFGFLKEILVSPVPRSHIALGKILGAATTGIIEGALLLLISPFLNIQFSLKLYLEGLVIIFLIAYGMAALGIVLTARMARTESFSFVLQIIIAPMVFLSGGLFPLTNSPIWMIKLARFNPLTYGINSLRWAILENTLPIKIIQELTTSNFVSSLCILIAFNFLITLLSIQLFKKIR